MAKTKWVRISVALTKEELEKLNIVKKWHEVTYRDMLINVVVKLIWDDVPKKYRKKFEDKQKKQKKRAKKQITEIRKRKAHSKR